MRGGMGLRAWAAWTAVVWTVAFALGETVFWASSTAGMLDVGAEPPRSYLLAELIHDVSPGPEVVTFLVAEVPALLWRRRGGGGRVTLALAVAGPLGVVAPILVPKGYPEDFLIPFLAAFVLLLSLAAGGLICALYRPLPEEE